MRIAPHRTRCFVALAAVATLLLVPVGAARGAANSTESTMAREIADDINQERAARGLSAVPFDASYSVGAQRVAERNRDQPCHACHSDEYPSSEVVWWGSDYGSSGATIWWMGSPPHRAFLLAPNATRIGVGVACNGTAHDAVAWIETTAGAQNPSPTPVATKAGTGSRCKGGSSTATTTATTTAAKASATTAPRAAAGSATTIRTPVSAGDRAPATTTTRKRAQTATTVARRSSADAAAAEPDAPLMQAAGAPGFVQLDEAARMPIASASRPVSGRNGVGALGTAVLLFTFTGALVVGRATHRR